MAAKKPPKGQVTVPACVTDAPDAIRADLLTGDVTPGAYTAQAAVLGILAAIRRGLPAPESDLRHAELEGILAGLAMRFATQPATKPAGYVSGRPTGAQLREVFNTALARTLGPAAAGGTA